MRYYVCIDENTQWFHYLADEDEFNKNWAETSELSDVVATTAFCQNLFSRESLGIKTFIKAHGAVEKYTSWSISKKEFDKLKRMNEIVAYFNEFNKLAKYD